MSDGRNVNHWRTQEAKPDIVERSLGAITFGNSSDMDATMRDFTLQKYGLLIQFFRDHDLPVFGVQNWHAQNPNRGVLIRHDVDRKPMNALEMAIFEEQLGIKTTYYFRVVGSAYSSKVIRSVAELGHEVGYHYEDLALANGDIEKAHKLFGEHLADLRKLADVKTVAMHGSPLSRHNNVDIWQSGSLTNYELEADAFISIDYSEIPYFTDTGRSWGADATNLRDKPETREKAESLVESTDDLLEFLRTKDYQRFAISAHPERWSTVRLDWMSQLIKDQGVNYAKRILRVIR